MNYNAEIIRPLIVFLDIKGCQRIIYSVAQFDPCHKKTFCVSISAKCSSPEPLGSTQVLKLDSLKGSLNSPLCQMYGSYAAPKPGCKMCISVI